MEILIGEINTPTTFNIMLLGNFMKDELPKIQNAHKTFFVDESINKFFTVVWQPGYDKMRIYKIKEMPKEVEEKLIGLMRLSFG